MARPTKQGIDYFPLDVQFDEKIELYLIEKEATGLAVMITLWQLIYQNEGYYITNSKDLSLLVKRRINADRNDIDTCINVMLQRGIFDKELHNKYGVLTSRAVQKRYFDAAKRKKEVKVAIKYILIDVSSYENIVNVYTNRVNDLINGVNAGGNATKEEVDTDIKENTEEKKSKLKKPLSKKVTLVTQLGKATLPKKEKEPATFLKPKNRDNQEIEKLVTNYITHITSCHKNNAPKKTPTLVASCCLTVERLIRLDNYELDYIATVLRWASVDEFWRYQIVSLAGLRKKGKNGQIKFKNIALAYERNHTGGENDPKVIAGIYSAATARNLKNIKEWGYLDGE